MNWAEALLNRNQKILLTRSKEKKWSAEMQALFEKELSKLSRMNPAAGEYSVQVGYLETLT